MTNYVPTEPERDRFGSIIDYDGDMRPCRHEDGYHDAPVHRAASEPDAGVDARYRPAPPRPATERRGASETLSRGHGALFRAKHGIVTRPGYDASRDQPKRSPERRHIEYLRRVARGKGPNEPREA